MDITIELIFALVQAVITGILGSFLKDNIIPAKYIPLQNIGIGVVSAIVAVYFNIFNDIPTAIFFCLVISLGVGGTYDLIKTRSKD